MIKKFLLILKNSFLFHFLLLLVAIVCTFKVTILNCARIVMSEKLAILSRPAVCNSAPFYDTRIAPSPGLFSFSKSSSKFFRYCSEK